MYSTAAQKPIEGKCLVTVKYNNVAEAFQVTPSWIQLSGEGAHGGVCGYQVLGLVLFHLYPKGSLEQP